MNFEHTLTFQILIFLTSAIVIWYFCNKLSDVVEYIDSKYRLGAAFGGTLILSIVTNLPEIAITISGAMKGNFDLVTGNLLGGIAMQSMLLIGFDFFSKKPQPLSTLTASKVGIYQSLALIVILIICFAGSVFKEKPIAFGAGISVWSIAIIWLGFLLMLKKFQQPTTVVKNDNSKSKFSPVSSIIWLICISAIVLYFGVLLGNSSDAIAKHFNISGVFFGATILALVTSLPEISSGLEFIKNQDYKPIISDIIGGNGFLPVLFLPASIIAGQNIVASAGRSNDLLIILSIVLVLVFLLGMKKNAPNKIHALGWDTWSMLLLGICGFAVLYFIS